MKEWHSTNGCFNDMHAFSFLSSCSCITWVQFWLFSSSPLFQLYIPYIQHNPSHSFFSLLYSLFYFIILFLSLFLFLSTLETSNLWNNTYEIKWHTKKHVNKPKYVLSSLKLPPFALTRALNTLSLLAYSKYSVQ